MTRAKAILASYLGVLAYASLVFLGAWRLNYWRGLLYVSLAILGAAISQLLLPAGSDLATRRIVEVNAGEAWDCRLLRAMALVNAAMFLLAGMDSGRFHWSPPVALSVTVVGGVCMLAGQLIFALAMRENAFFSSTVRIQVERGHSVCETGLYRLVRHPGYFGLLLSILAFPALMGSYWAFLPALASIGILIIRTVTEDRFLMNGLRGYKDYAARTSSRLIPGVF